MGVEWTGMSFQKETLVWKGVLTCLHVSVCNTLPVDIFQLGHAFLTPTTMPYNHSGLTLAHSPRQDENLPADLWSQG